MAGLQTEQHQPDEGIAGRTTQRLAGTGFERSRVRVVVVGRAGSQRGLGQWYFHQKQRALGVAVAATHIPGEGACKRACRRRLVEGLELQEARLELAKVIGGRPARRVENSPGQSSAANDGRQASQDEQLEARRRLCRGQELISRFRRRIRSCRWEFFRSYSNC